MNKLLALSVALLSLNLYGADKPKVLADGVIFSRDGLEGFGIKGIQIYTNKDTQKDFYADKYLYDYQAAIDVIELALIRAGFKVVKHSEHTIWIDVRTYIDNAILEPADGKEIRKHIGGTLSKHEVTLTMKRLFSFESNGKRYRTYGICNRAFTFNDHVGAEKNKWLKGYVNIMVSVLSRANPEVKRKE